MGDRVAAQLVGPCFLAGDWTFEPDQLAARHWCTGPGLRFLRMWVAGLPNCFSWALSEIEIYMLDLAGEPWPNQSSLGQSLQSSHCHFHQKKYFCFWTLGHGIIVSRCCGTGPLQFWPVTWYIFCICCDQIVESYESYVAQTWFVDVWLCSCKASGKWKISQLNLTNLPPATGPQGPDLRFLRMWVAGLPNCFSWALSEIEIYMKSISLIWLVNLDQTRVLWGSLYSQVIVTFTRKIFLFLNLGSWHHCQQVLWNWTITILTCNLIYLLHFLWANSHESYESWVIWICIAQTWFVDFWICCDQIVMGEKWFAHKGAIMILCNGSWIIIIKLL